MDGENQLFLSDDTCNNQDSFNPFNVSGLESNLEVGKEFCISNEHFEGKGILHLAGLPESAQILW